MNLPVHHQAPPLVEGVSPFTTPGTRCVWSSGDDWLRHLVSLLNRRCASKTYADIAAHLDELARHPDFIAAQPLEDLRPMRAMVLEHYQPPKGQRAGTSYERVLTEITNAIQRLEREARSAAA